MTPAERNAVAQGIIARAARYGWTQGDGDEWAYINGTARAEFRDAVLAGNVAAVLWYLDRMFRGRLYFGLVSMTASIDAVATQLLWRLALWTHLTPARGKDMPLLVAPDVGAPIVVETEDGHGGTVRVAVDTPRFDYYAQHLATVAGASARVLEIGGGYGGVALQRARRSPGAAHVLCDIPETLYLAWFWLAATLGYEAVAWDDETRAAPILLLPTAALATYDAPVDMVFSAHTMSGLAPEERARVLAYVKRSGATHWVHDDAVEAARDGVWLSARYMEALAPFDGPRGFTQTGVSRVPWIGVSDRFALFTYTRSAA